MLFMAVLNDCSVVVELGMLVNSYFTFIMFYFLFVYLCFSKRSGYYVFAKVVHFRLSPLSPYSLCHYSSGCYATVPGVVRLRGAGSSSPGPCPPIYWRYHVTSIVCAMWDDASGMLPGHAWALLLRRPCLVSLLIHSLKL
jgi:hypothetical protein